MKSKFLLLITFTVLIVGGVFAAGQSDSVEAKTVIKFPVVGDSVYDYLNDVNNVTNAYSKEESGVVIELEYFNSSTKYYEMMKIRNSANEMSDLTYMKPWMVTKFSDFLADLSDLDAAKKNKFSDMMTKDGKVIGLASYVQNEFVYYRKSIFKEYGIAIPQTWNEMVEAFELIKEKGEYIPIMMGAKDAWSTYPFNEFMPSLVANDGNYWNVMASQDEPFSEGTPFYESYQIIDELYSKKLFGPDPLGIGWNQARNMFAAKQGASIFGGVWALTEIVADMNGDMSDIGMFYMPMRDDVNSPLLTVAQPDGILGVNGKSENVEEAKKFVNWFLTSNYYPEYLKYTDRISTIKGIENPIPVLSAIPGQVKGGEVQFVVYDGGGEEFQAIVDDIQFNYKVMGQKMIAGEDLGTMLTELNSKWKAARERLF
ncbi:carbohydrate ABC transporter substrate-binding protein [Oceanispirochaeta crateris]|uniref:Carbohydrate ABC transporter substrate-binding protein n=1 Tax=Oceanispirochaeta crateris TaxID=2518645 RepID=A0A5C1QNZ4_9SPIO|nr:ABC transporter substrate-binding protein [Oceanispirochaeta crateris]QEN08949.1 carbohydrate ABC transporter substrate-binding protein [Oceanispirochaeta crateris]